MTCNDSMTCIDQLINWKVQVINFYFTLSTLLLLNRIIRCLIICLNFKFYLFELVIYKILLIIHIGSIMQKETSVQNSFQDFFKSISIINKKIFRN